MSSPSTLTVLCSVGAIASAQINPVSCEFSPNVVQLGGSVEVKMWNNTASTTFQSGACNWFQIYYSGANGQPAQAQGGPWLEGVGTFQGVRRRLVIGERVLFLIARVGERTGAGRLERRSVFVIGLDE